MSEASLGPLGPAGLGLIGDVSRPSGVTLAFSGRLGGVSTGPYASLNIGCRVGDDERAVAENRRILLAALGGAELADRLVNPKQVHGTTVLSLTDPSEAALEAFRATAEEGADALCVTVPRVPVLLGFADCVPVILVAPGGFAVVHSGWKGTIAKIGALALAELCSVSSCAPGDVRAYVGPHIQGADYEVSPELLAEFVETFGPEVAVDERHLALARAVEATLTAAGVGEESICICEDSTASAPDLYFSHRRDGVCGRQGAIAWLAE